MRPSLNSFRNGVTYGVMFAAACLLASCALQQTAPLPPRKAPLGANIEGIADWMRSMPFADVMKSTRAFGKPDQPWVAISNLDAQGWPKEDFGLVLFAALNGVKGLGGTYKISFKSNGTPQIKAVASSANITNLKKTADTWTADMIPPNEFEQIMLSFTGTNGGVRDLKIMRPGTQPSDTFYKPFLDHVRRFTTIRYMDWGSTNGNRLEKWEDRPTPSSPSFSGPKGVAYETMIDLSNTIKADAWICIPAHANDQYVKNLAELCKKRLDPSLKLYVEYSNEVWNWSFEQATHNMNMANADAAKDPKMSWDGQSSKWTWPARRIGKRTAEISETFKAVYGADFKTKVRPVLCTQVVWPENWLYEGMNYIAHNYAKPNEVIYAIAGAPYFNAEEAKKLPNATKDDILNALEKVVDEMPNWAKFKEHQQIMQKYGVKWLCYEAGPDTFGPEHIQAKKASQFDPRMERILAKYWKTWRSGGGDLMNYFIAGATNYDSQYGTWGLTDDITKTDTAKIRALDAILNGKL